MSGYVVGQLHPSVSESVRRRADVHVITGGWLPDARADFAQYLRKMADRVDAGDVTDMVMMYCDDNTYCYKRWTSKFSAVALTAMAHEEALRMMRE